VPSLADPALLGSILIDSEPVLLNPKQSSPEVAFANA
jgi:hypothetical protein